MHVKGPFGYSLFCWKLKTLYKIIFKCVNSAMRPSFEVVFTEKNTCESHKQCMEPKGKYGTQPKSAF